MIKKLTYLGLFILTLQFNAIAQQWPGLTLIGTSNTAALSLLDTAGTTKKTINCTGGNNTYSNYLTKGGFFWRTLKATNAVLTGGGMHGRIQKYNWNGVLLWDYSHASSTYNLHHDFCVMPNGNVLVISYDVKNTAAVTALGSSYTTGDVWFEKIMELEPTGLNTQNVVWEWHMADHVCQNTNSANPNYVSSVPNNPQLFNLALVNKKDFAHLNGIDFDEVNNQIIFSCHNLNELYIIDHSTTAAEAATHVGGNSGKGGDLLYRYGRTSNYGIGGQDNINVIHDAHLVRKGPFKNMIGFMHNKGVSTMESCGDYIAVPRSGNGFTVTAGGTFAPTTYTKRVKASINTSNMGSIEEYENGNIMLCSAIQGTVKEIDSLQNIIWTYQTGQVAQAHRYNMCDISLAPPVQPIINNASGVLSVPTLAGASYQWTYNGNVLTSAQAATYNAGNNFGNYSLIVLDSFGCASPVGAYVYNSNGLVKMEKLISISPNPAKENLIINTDLNLQGNSILIYDIIGKLVWQSSFSNKIDITTLKEGFYFLNITHNKQIILSHKFQKVN